MREFSIKEFKFSGSLETDVQVCVSENERGRGEEERGVERED